MELGSARLGSASPDHLDVAEKRHASPPQDSDNQPSNGATVLLCHVAFSVGIIVKH